MTCFEYKSIFLKIFSVVFLNIYFFLPHFKISSFTSFFYGRCWLIIMPWKKQKQWRCVVCCRRTAFAHWIFHNQDYLSSREINPCLTMRNEPLVLSFSPYPLGPTVEIVFFVDYDGTQIYG